MTKKEHDEGGLDPLKLTAQAVAGAAGVAASDPNASALAISIGAGLAVAPDILGRAADWYRSRAERRWREYFELLEGLLRGSKAVDGRLVAQLFADSNNEEVQELVVESARVIAEAMAPSAVPVMARLTHEYAVAGKGPDKFFRAMRRLLSDVTEDEFQDLRSVVRTVDAARFGPPGFPWLEIISEAASKDDGVARSGPQTLKVAGRVLTAGGVLKGDDTVLCTSPPNAARALAVLQGSGLAHPGTPRWGTTLPASCLIESSMLRRLAQLL